jgi:hypothetical protein
MLLNLFHHVNSGTENIDILLIIDPFCNSEHRLLENSTTHIRGLTHYFNVLPLNLIGSVFASYRKKEKLTFI